MSYVCGLFFNRFQQSDEAWGTSIQLLMSSATTQVQVFSANVLLQKSRLQISALSEATRDELIAAVLSQAEVFHWQFPLCASALLGFLLALVHSHLYWQPDHIHGCRSCAAHAVCSGCCSDGVPLFRLRTLVSTFQKGIRWGAPVCRMIDFSSLLTLLVICFVYFSTEYPGTIWAQPYVGSLCTTAICE